MTANMQTIIQGLSKLSKMAHTMAHQSEDRETQQAFYAASDKIAELANILTKEDSARASNLENGIF